MAIAACPSPVVPSSVRGVLFFCPGLVAHGAAALRTTSAHVAGEVVAARFAVSRRNPPAAPPPQVRRWSQAQCEQEPKRKVDRPFARRCPSVSDRWFVLQALHIAVAPRLSGDPNPRQVQPVASLMRLDPPPRVVDAEYSHVDVVDDALSVDTQLAVAHRGGPRWSNPCRRPVHADTPSRSNHDAGHAAAPAQQAADSVSTLHRTLPAIVSRPRSCRQTVRAPLALWTLPRHIPDTGR